MVNHRDYNDVDYNTFWYNIFWKIIMIKDYKWIFEINNCTKAVIFKLEINLIIDHVFILWLSIKMCFII